MLLLLLLVLAALAAACPPPLNDFKYLGNDTHTTSDIIQALLGPTSDGGGWTEIVTAARIPWPKGVIEYCFTDEAARKEFEPGIKAAWQLWLNRIGEASQQNGHTLVLREHKFQEDCYSKGTQNWNPNVPKDIAAFGFDHTPGVQAWSIVGYMLKEWDDSPDRHGARFDTEAKARYPRDYWITTVAHELGHIFGFWHEHQREDRNSYVHFDCAKLIGYAGAKELIEKAGNKHTIEQVCNNYFLGLTYGFNAIQGFDTIDHVAHDKDGKEATLFITTDLEFDDESSMLYSSTEFQSPDWSNHDVMQVPLVFWKHRGMGFTPPSKFTREDLEMIPVNWQVSEGDYEGIKHIYPW